MINRFDLYLAIIISVLAVLGTYFIMVWYLADVLEVAPLDITNIVKLNLI